MYLDWFKYAEFNVGVHFCYFRPEEPFLGKFGPKIKIVSLSWNLVPRLIWICRIKWWCSLFPFSTGNTFFCANVVPKFKFVSLSCNQWYLQSFTKYLRQTLVFMLNSTLRKSSIAIFQELLASIEKFFILAGRLSTGL